MRRWLSGIAMLGLLACLPAEPQGTRPQLAEVYHNSNFYITASHINESPTYNEGRSARTSPYAVFKFNPKD
jgi:hypothetical protein